MIVYQQNNTPTQHPAPNAQQHRKHIHRAQQNILTTKKRLGVLDLISVHFPPPPTRLDFSPTNYAVTTTRIRSTAAGSTPSNLFSPCSTSTLNEWKYIRKNTLFPTIPWNQQAQQSLIINDYRYFSPFSTTPFFTSSNGTPMELHCLTGISNGEFKLTYYLLLKK